MSLGVASSQARFKRYKNYMIRFNLGAAERFLDAFEEKCVLLADFSELGRSSEELAPSLRSLPRIREAEPQ
ncbi:MAG: type II toxin-antitoxin system RelE/ParE family toxin [Nostoc sp.]